MLDALRDHFATYGPVYAWAPLKSFYRIIVVYHSEDDAEHAKESCDRLIVGSIDNRYDSVDSLMFVQIGSFILQSCGGIEGVPCRPDNHLDTVREWRRQHLPSPSKAREEFPHLSSGLTARRLGTYRRRTAKPYASC